MVNGDEERKRFMNCLSSQRKYENNGSLFYEPGARNKKKVTANDMTIMCNEQWMEADKFTMVHLVKNGGFQFIIVLLTRALSHFFIITLRFLVFFLNIKLHDLLFESVFLSYDDTSRCHSSFFLLGAWRRGKYVGSYLPCAFRGTEQLQRFLSSRFHKLSQITQLFWQSTAGQPPTLQANWKCVRLRGCLCVSATSPLYNILLTENRYTDTHFHRSHTPRVVFSRHH